MHMATVGAARASAAVVVVAGGGVGAGGSGGAGGRRTRHVGALWHVQVAPCGRRARRLRLRRGLLLHDVVGGEPAERGVVLASLPASPPPVRTLLEHLNALPFRQTELIRLTGGIVEFCNTNLQRKARDRGKLEQRMAGMWVCTLVRKQRLATKRASDQAT